MNFHYKLYITVKMYPCSQMSGNQISVKTLDLNRDFSEIAAQLNAIVYEYFERSGLTET